MGGKGGSTTPSPQVSQGLLNDDTALVNIANQQEQNSQQLFNLGEPAFIQSLNYDETLASGDPGAVLRAIAPQTQQINQATAGAKANIMATEPAGGEKNLALENADVARGAQVGNVASGAIQNSYKALGQAGGQAIGQSQSGIGEAIGAESAGAGALSNLGNLQVAEQQVQAESKGQSLGLLGGLAGDAAGLGGAGKLAGGAGAAGAAGGAAKGADVADVALVAAAA